MCFFFFSSRRRHTRLTCDWSSDVCSSDLGHADRRATAINAEPARRNGGDHCRRHRKRNPDGRQAESVSTFLYNAAGRKRHRTCQHLPNCAASQRFDKLYIGGWPRNDISDRVAARRLSMQIIPALIYTNERSSKKFLLLACVCALLSRGVVT